MYKHPLLPRLYAPVANATRAWRILLLCISMSFCFSQLHAQTALLKDINRALASNGSSEFSNFAVTSQKMFFTSYGNWWTSGGTSESTLFLKKFSGVSSKAVIGNELFFNGTDGNGESELWKSNGTAAGTIRVKDIFAGVSGSFPDKLTVANGKLFFVANDGSGRELWISDGTLAGTKLISDILKGSGSSNPNNLTVVNEILFFTANDGQHGYELWKTDGTPTGTAIVKDIRVEEKASSSPTWLANVNGELFFSATNGITGSELWKSDGTAAGTVFVKDIRVGSVSAGIENLINLNGVAMFTANDGIHGDELWKSNGSATGTMLVKDLNPGPKGSNGTDFASQPMSNFTVIGNALYFAAGKEKDPEFYVRSDGSDAGTKILINTMHLGFNPLEPRFTYLNGYIYFFNLSPAGTFPGDNGYATYNLVRMDLSGENIVSVKSLEKFIDYGSEESPYQNVMVFNGKLFLNARMNGGLKFASFTTSTNTLTAIKDIDAPTLSSYPNFFLRMNDLVYFETNFEVSEPNDPWVGSPEELYRTDGTTSGTFKIANLNYGLSKVAISDKLFFSRSTDAGWSLCYTYGTPGTITTLLSGTGTNVPRNLTNVHGLLYYFNDAGQLWKSDGTTTGTVLLGNLNRITSIADVNGKAFVLTETADGGMELWRTNATGLLRVKTLRTGPATTTRSYPTAVVGNIFYFVANDGVHGNEVWRTDGTSIGTYMISDANTSDDVDSYEFEFEITSFTVYNNTLYYSAQDKDNNWALWSATGNVKLTGFDAIDYSIVFNGKMFLFPRIVPESRFHTIYVSDGTMAGTTYLGNLLGQGGISFAILNNKLFFSSGTLTTSDGTVCGTYRIPGAYGVYPIEGIGNDLIFASTSYKTGEELFIYRDLGSITDPICSESIAGDRQSSETNSITLYPNPYTDEFALKINDISDESIDIEIYDALGFPIQILEDIQSNTDLGHFGANWLKGIYFVKANVGGRITTTRIAKR